MHVAAPSRKLFVTVSGETNFSFFFLPFPRAFFFSFHDEGWPRRTVHGACTLRVRLSTGETCPIACRIVMSGGIRDAYEGTRDNYGQGYTADLNQQMQPPHVSIKREFILACTYFNISLAIRLINNSPGYSWNSRFFHPFLAFPNLFFQIPPAHNLAKGEPSIDLRNFLGKHVNSPFTAFSSLFSLFQIA